MLRYRLSALLLLIAAGGCFPIELSVSKDGKILIPREEGFFIFDPSSGETKRLASAGEEKPVFARFSPDGKSALLAQQTEGSNLCTFTPVSLADGVAGKDITSKNSAYVLYSPDSAKIAISRASEKKNEKLNQQLPEIFVTSLEGGEGKVVVQDVGAMFRWFADSKRLLVFQIAEKDQDNHYLGKLATVDVETGKIAPLASLKVQQNSYFDLSPDNTKVLFNALAAGRADADVAKMEGSESLLHELDVATGEVRKTNKKVTYAIYSPDGRQVLLGTPFDLDRAAVFAVPAAGDRKAARPRRSGFSFDMDSLVLEVADAGLQKFTPVAPNAYMPMMSMGGQGRTYPGWIDNDRLFYFVQKMNYGTEGKALALMTVGADGKGAKCVQPQIDIGVMKTAE